MIFFNLRILFTTFIFLKNIMNFIFLSVFVFLFLNIPQAISSKREAINLPDEHPEAASSYKKQFIISSINHRIVALSSQPQSTISIDPYIEENKTSKSNIISYSSNVISSQLNLPLKSDISDKDEILEDQIFLAAVETLEKKHELQKNLSLSILPNSDDFFSNPEVLNSINKAEEAYLLQKKLISPQKAVSHQINSRLLDIFENHQDHLFDSIKKAKNSILITSHNFSANLKTHRKLFESLREASQKNVKIYLYFNKDSFLKDEEINFLEEAGIKLSNTAVHAKLLIIDKNIITCGSFDWLSNPAYTRQNKDASIILEGKYLNPFIEDIWGTLKKYNQLSYSFHHQEKLERTFSELSSQVFYDDSKNEEFELLTIPHQHDEFFLECLETAKHNITMCSPFITRDKEHLEFIFPKDLLRSFLKDGKILHVFYRANDENLHFLQQHLAEFTVPNLILSPIDNLHRKTLIVDETYIEGSFNWLSSARSLEDEYALMETSFILKGVKAQTFINTFYHKIK